MSKMKKLKDSDIFIILIVVLAIILLIASAGKLDFTKKEKELKKPIETKKLSKEEQEEIERIQKLEKLQDKKARLENNITTKEKLQTKLFKRYKRLYFYSRVSIVITILTPFVIFSSFKGIHSFSEITSCIESLLNYVEFLILSVLTIYFIFTGSIHDITKLNNQISNAVKNRVFRNNLDIEEQIHEMKEKLEVLITEIEEFNNKI